MMNHNCACRMTPNSGNVRLPRMFLSLFAMLMGLSVCVAQTDTLIYSINEERAPSYFVADLWQDSGIDLPEPNSTIRFSFLPQAGGGSAYFDLDEETGILRTASIIDHEEICPHQSDCPLNIRVKADTLDASGQMLDFHLILATINILDLNDNGPVFSPNVITIDIPESVMIGSTFGITSAYDPDSGINSIQGYYLEPNDVFEIEVTSLSDGSVTVQLVVMSRLDYEIQNNYTLTLVAYDGGETSYNGSATLEITVTDGNDNSPIFIRDDYDVTLAEDTPTGTTIFTVLATDNDSGENGRVLYGFSEETIESIDGTFEIDSASGEIVLSKMLDYEGTKLYQLSLTATDNGPSPLPTYQQLKVTVTNVNDHGPIITISILGDGVNGEAAVSEKSDIGTFVARVIFSDPDGNNVTCILNSPDFELAPLNTGDHQILTTREFDREVQDTYNISITCTDDGQPPLTSTEKITIHISDWNDNAPVFLNSLYTATVVENQTAPIFVTQVSATDVDLGVNSMIEYSFEDPSVGTWLHIDADSGQIETVRPLDYENTTYMAVVLLAKDKGRPVRTGTATLELTIQDDNDQTAVFSNSSYVMSIRENVPLNTTAGKVTATDADSDANNQIVYFIEWPYSWPRAFAVNENTGWITTSGVMDREEMPEYSFSIRAYNPNIPSMKTQSNITIKILDENDNAPRFIMPNESHKRFQIPSQLPEGHPALQVSVLDDDLAENAELTYEMSCINECMDIFTINSTGCINSQASLVPYGTTSYEVRLKATDKGIPPLTTTFDCTLIVNSSVPFIAPPVEPIDYFWEEWGLTWQTMAAIGAACLLFLILLIFICCVLISRHRRRQKKKRAKAAIVAASQQDSHALLLARGCNGAVGGGKDRRSMPDGVTAIALDGIYDAETSTDGEVITWPPPGVDIGGRLVGMSRPSSVNSNSSRASHAELNDSGAFAWPEPDRKALHHSHETGLDIRQPQHPHGPPRTGSYCGPLSRSYDSDLENKVRAIYKMLMDNKSQSGELDAGSFTDSGRGGSEEESRHAGRLSDISQHDTSLPDFTMEPEIRHLLEQLALQQLARREYVKLPPGERQKRAFLRNSLLDDSISEVEEYAVTRPAETPLTRGQVHRHGSYNMPSTGGATNFRHPSSDSEINKGEFNSILDQYLNADSYEYLPHSAEEGYAEYDTKHVAQKRPRGGAAMNHNRQPKGYSPRSHEREVQRRLQGFRRQGYGNDARDVESEIGVHRSGREKLEYEQSLEGRYHRPHRGKRRTSPIKRPPPHVNRAIDSNTSDDDTSNVRHDLKWPRTRHVEEYELERLRHRRTLSDESDDTTRPISSVDDGDAESPDVPSDGPTQKLSTEKDTKNVHPLSHEGRQNTENEKRFPQIRISEHTNHDRTNFAPRKGLAHDLPKPIRKRRVDDVSSTDALSDCTTTSGSYAMSDGTEYVV